MSRRTRIVIVGAALLACATVSGTAPHASGASCVNPVACENHLPGTPQSNWDIPVGAGTTIQGFADPFSVNLGGTVHFKIKSPATGYAIDIYRMGYYGGDGARLVASVKPSISVSHNQPTCHTNTAAGLVDCSNWGVSASWTVPASLVSGVYFAHVQRTDGSTDENQIPFVVRNDTSTSTILLGTDDETWQAYNDWGGYSLYTGNATDTLNRYTSLDAGRAEQVSYDRPFATRFDVPNGEDYFFYAEFPTIEFLEENGYDVSYIDQGTVGSAQGASLLERHKLFLKAGHDEYWTASEVANVTAARNARVNLAFFTGNEVYWKTRWAADAAGEAGRTLITYKESLDSAITDPEGPSVWTGEWMDPRFSPPGDGGRPQNALTGQLWTVNQGTYAIQVPAAYSKLRFWRNTGVASLQPGQMKTLAPETLGYEWDQDVDNGFRPAGEFDMSSTTQTVPQATYDYQEDLSSQTLTHHLTEYRAASGALVFEAGTVQWAWGLNSNHDGDSQNPPNKNMQQATVNILADMGVQPTTLMSNLVRATASTDKTAPTSTITSPPAGANFSDGARVTISGTATDSGGVVAGVEISTDGGRTWHPVTTMSPANTKVTWSYKWIAHGSPSAVIKTRATDDSGNIETPSDAKTVHVGCPCSLWGPNVAPGGSTGVDSGDGKSVEVGVKFTSAVYGVVNGIRFYKASTNTGTHIGNLWKANGQLLATAVFTNETASGWQRVNFAHPVLISPYTTYIASYFAPSGHYSQTAQYFYPLLAGGATLNAPPLHAEQSTQSHPDGVYVYTTSNAFPSQTFNGENYWVDVSFTPVTASAAFVQQAGAHTGSATTLSVTPAANLTVGNRLVVLAGIRGSGGPTAKTVTDSARDTYTEVLHFKASNGTEMSVWTAPITAGGGIKPTIKVTSSAQGDIGIEALEYSGLSSAAGTGAIDQKATATGTTGSSSGTVRSAATPATTAANELVLGFYLDSGFGDTLSAGTGFTKRANVSPNGNMEFLVEDAKAPKGATPAASVGTGAKTIWLMSTVVFKL